MTEARSGVLDWSTRPQYAVAIGATLAALATALNLTSLWGALHHPFDPAPVTVSYTMVTGITAVSTLLLVARTVVPVVRGLRVPVHRPGTADRSAIPGPEHGS